MALFIGLAPPARAAPAAGMLPDYHTITITVSRDKPKGKEVTGGNGETAIGGGEKSGGGSTASGTMPDAHTITITVTRDRKKPGSEKKPKETALPGGGAKDITAGDNPVIRIDSSTHHLGDNNFKGNPNAQLLQASEGASYEKAFMITAAQMPPNNLSASLTLTARGAQDKNPVAINGVRVGTLGMSTDDGSFHNFKFTVDICALREGSNSIKIKSADHGGGDIDDFEFKDIRLELKPYADTDMQDAQLAKISSVQITDASFAKPLSEIGKNGNFWVRAKGDGRCKELKDMAVAMVYPKGAGEADRMQVNLIETGPDTSEFHSEKAVSVTSIKARPGQTIIVRSGLRGTSIQVKADGSSRQKSETESPTHKENVSKRKQEKDAQSKQRPGKTSKSTPAKTATGAKGGSGQVTIPVRGGSSRKHVGVPAKTQPTKQKPARSVQWTAYKLQSFASMHSGGLPKMNVVKIGFRRGANMAQLYVKSYPISLSRNDRTGEILWSVNWSNEDVEAQRMASNPAAMDALQQQAERLRGGTVPKAGLAAWIKRQIGPKGRHLQ